MVLERQAIRPVFQCLRCIRQERVPRLERPFTTTASSRLETETQPPSEAPPPPVEPTKILDPNLVSTPASERRLIQNQRIMPVGSRRRRAAIASTTNIPFTQLPYQCFQEARKYLQEDRKEKLEAVRVQRERIQRLQAKDVAPQDEAHKEHRLDSMRRRLEELKILADINDPMVKKRFEDGEGDMNKPIYRYLADKQWRAYKRCLLMQRIEQMNVIPDVLPVIDPVVSTTISFAGRKTQHGDFVDSLLSERPPALQIQPYDKGSRLYTIAVINSDVPNVEKDAFDYRCHFLASNVEISPTNTNIHLGRLNEETQVVLPWLPPYAQNGTPYQRMSVFILQQPADESGTRSQSIDIAEIRKAGRYTKRHGFVLRSLVNKLQLKPVGVDLFRTQWDDNTAGVMQRAGIAGWDLEFRRKIVQPLPYKRKSSERYR